MAKIRDFAITEYVATSANWVPEMPIHQSGDVLVAFLGKDSTTGWSQSTGWTEYIDQATAQANVGCQMIRATSSAEVFNVTLTTETGVVVILAIQDCYGSTLANAIDLSPVVAGADATTIPFAGIAGQSTTNANCLILYAFGGDGGTSPTAYPPATNLYSGDATNGSLGVAYSFQKTAGTIATVDWFGRGVDDGRAMLLALRSSGSGLRQAYSDPSISSSTMIRPLVGLSTMQSDSWPTSLTLTALGANFEATSVYVYEVAPSYTDRTSEANSVTTADLTFCQHVGDMMYFGSSTPFRTISAIVSTAGTIGVVAWEYGTGASSWTTAPGMSGTFSATGGARIAFTSETAPTNWVTNDPGMGQTKYWVRMRITTNYTVVPIVSMVRLNGHIAAYIVAAASADAGTNPYTDACQNAGASSTTTLNGCQLNFGASVDMSAGILFGSIRPSLPRDFGVDLALPSKSAGGVQVTLLDGSNYYNSYKIGAKGCKTLDIAGRSVFAIDWNGSATAWASAGTIVKSAVTKLYLSTYGYYGASLVQWSMFCLMTRFGIAGGSTSNYLDLDDIADVANKSTGHFPFISVVGTAAKIYAPLQFGGNDPILVNCNLNTFQFPTVYDGVDYFDWNAATNVAGVKFYPKTGDTLKFTNCVFTSDSAYRFEFDASSATNATLDFSGTSVVNGTVTLQNIGTAFNNMTFISCPSFTKNASTISNSSFTATKVTSSSPANTALISDCTFTSSGTGHAIEIGGTAANFSFDGNIFTGYASSDGSTGNEAIFVNIASGSMTITITGGGSIPSIKTAGVTVTVENPVSITVTVKDEQNNNIENARVSILTAGTVSMYGAVADDGGAQTVQTTASNNATTNDMTLLPVTPVTGDAYYFGSAEPFYKMTLNVGQNGVGTWTILWEYYNGSSWATIPDVNDGTSGFTSGSGNKDVTFSPPANWATTTIQSIQGFWIRARVSAYTSITTQPLGTQSWVYHQIMNELTNASGVATESFNYLVDTSVTIRVRKSSTGTTKYIPVNTTGTILSTGFSLTQTMIVDANVDLGV